MTGLKETLRQGGTIYGTWLNNPTPSQVEIIGHAGFDFVMLDTEHASYDIAGSENLIRAADAAGLPAMVRVHDNSVSAIGRVLDYGAQGVMVPHVSSLDEARRAVSGAHYPPLGERGAAPTVRAAAYGHIAWADYRASAGAETLVVVQVEGAEGLAHLDEIVAVPGIDVIFVGPFDLSGALGVSGQLDHPKLLAAVGDIVERARARGLSVGIWMPSPAQIRPWVARGVQFVTVANADLIFYEACRRMAAELRG